MNNTNRSSEEQHFLQQPVFIWLLMYVHCRDGVLKDWPWTQGHLEDKFWCPWPRNGLPLASKTPGLVALALARPALAWRLGLEEICSKQFYSLLPQSCIQTVSFTTTGG